MTHTITYRDRFCRLPLFSTGFEPDSIEVAGGEVFNAIVSLINLFGFLLCFVRTFSCSLVLLSNLAGQRLHVTPSFSASRIRLPALPHGRTSNLGLNFLSLHLRILPQPLPVLHLSSLPPVICNCIRTDLEGGLVTAEDEQQLYKWHRSSTPRTNAFGSSQQRRHTQIML